MQTENRLPAADELREAVQTENVVEVSATAVANMATVQIAQAMVQAAAEAQQLESISTDDDPPVDKQFFSVGHCCQ